MISFLLSLLLITTTDGAKPLQKFDPCKIYGKVYVEPNPRYAHMRVFEEKTDAFANVIVYVQTNALYADKPGMWTFVTDREQADVWIYFEKAKGLEDFIVYYTNYESFAGCNR